MYERDGFMHIKFLSGGGASAWGSSAGRRGLVHDHPAAQEATLPLGHLLTVAYAPRCCWQWRWRRFRDCKLWSTQLGNASLAHKFTNNLSCLDVKVRHNTTHSHMLLGVSAFIHTWYRKQLAPTLLVSQADASLRAEASLVAQVPSIVEPALADDAGARRVSTLAPPIIGTPRPSVSSLVVPRNSGGAVGMHKQMSSASIITGSTLSLHSDSNHSQKKDKEQMKVRVSWIVEFDYRCLNHVWSSLMIKQS
jgi:hypothetical protein